LFSIHVIQHVLLAMVAPVFFALGAYSMAMHLTLESAGDGVPPQGRNIA
jgi:cytochrome c oxidase assembly factor CtaG